MPRTRSRRQATAATPGREKHRPQCRTRCRHPPAPGEHRRRRSIVSLPPQSRLSLAFMSQPLKTPPPMTVYIIDDHPLMREAVVMLLQRVRVRFLPVYVALGLFAWFATFESGIHATIAGVVLGLLTRVVPDPGEREAPAERVQHRIEPLAQSVS